ncbi:MAG TPA: 2-oxoglutarate dehydrogenase complex dihydrolipoyllysine-residue succinyltransferase [Gemmatimonadaceae bacterium]
MISIKVPPLGESIVEGTISRWMKKEGDAVAAGDTLVELETDKITVEIPAVQGGVLVKRSRNEGDVVKVDEVLGEIDESATAAPGAAAAAPAPAAAAGPQAPAQPPAPAAGEVKASPAAGRVAAEQGVDLASVQGTGRGGMVTKQDVVTSGGSAAAAPAAPAAPAVPSPASPPAPRPQAPAPAPAASGARETREKMSTRRKRMAENLLNAKQSTAMLTTFNEVDMSAVNAFRAKHKERIEKETGIRLSALPFFVKAATSALAKYPIVNALLDGDAFVYRHYVNMGIAVASEAGLVVPNLKDVHAMPLLDIARAINAVAKKARDGKLTMDDLTGGTFTITNGGVFGSLMSTPILNHPQVGILGLHKVQDRPVALDGQVVIRPMMYVALSYDHRVVDGEQAVRFLVHVKEMIEDPSALLLG